MQKASISDGLGLDVDLLDFGARIYGINFKGSPLALGYDSLDDYLIDSFYLGASIGPITNRIANGQLTIDGDALQMPRNEGNNTLHSGGAGFDKKTWQLESHSPNQICYRLDYDMTQVGLKGQLTTWVIYRVTEGCLTIKYRTRCDTRCYINQTNHVYLNLDGIENTDISNHQFKIKANSYVAVDDHNLPTGDVKPIVQPINYNIENSPLREFDGLCDHHFNIAKADMNTLNPMLSGVSSLSGIRLDVSSNSLGFQFYTGKFLSSPFVPSGGFCVETQLAPDAINQPSFYSPFLEASQEREQITLFQFSQH